MIAPSRHLRLCHGKPGVELVRKPGLTVWMWGCSCEAPSGASVTARVALGWSDREASLIPVMLSPRDKIALLPPVCATRRLGHCTWQQCRLQAAVCTAWEASAHDSPPAPPGGAWQVCRPHFTGRQSSQVPWLHQHCAWSIFPWASPGALGHGLWVFFHFKVPEINSRWCHSQPEGGFHSTAGVTYNAKLEQATVLCWALASKTC